MSLVRVSVDIQPLSDGEVLLTCHGIKFKANSATAALVISLQQASSLSEAYTRYLSDFSAPRIDVETYKILTERLIERLHAPAPAQVRLGFPWLWARFRLLPAHACNLLVWPLQWLFKPRTLLAMMIAILATLVIFISSQFDVQFAEFRRQPFSTHLLLGLGSLMIHEFGHVAACGAFGVMHKGIQGGMMLFFPATFVELGDVWKARSLERIIINFAGSFMQLLAAAVAFLWNAILPSPIALAFAYLSVFLALMQLIPIKNSDGYWIFLDLFNKGSDQIFSFQHSLALKSEMSNRERWTHHALAIAMLAISTALLYSSFGYAKLAVQEIRSWLSLVERAGWVWSDFGNMNLKHMYRLLTFSLGSIILSLLVYRYIKEK